MTVVFAEDTPPAIRGLLKRWFIEPRPNVFVGSVNERTREKTIAYVRRNAPALRLLVIADARNCQGFETWSYGFPGRTGMRKCGLTLIKENQD